MVSCLKVGRYRGRTVLRALASGLGVGYVPLAPGTFGSLLALPLWYWGQGRGAVHFGLLAGIVALSLPSASAERKATGLADPPSVVIDEVAGMLLAATGIPWGLGPVVSLFALFRLFDVFKFGPARWFDARDGAVYVVADDLVAGLLANLACRGLLWLAG